MLCIRHEILPCSQQKIWAVLADPARTEVQDDTHFTVRDRRGRTTRCTVTTCDPPRHRVVLLENPRLTGRWGLVLEPAPGGTRVVSVLSVYPRPVWLRPLAYARCKGRQKRWFADLRRRLTEENEFCERK